MSSITTETGLAHIEELLEERNFTDALSSLQAVRASNELKNWSISDKSQLFYFSARVLYNLGRFSQALLQIKAALRLSRKVFDDNLYASEKLTFGLICTALGRHAFAEEAYLESYVFRKRAGTRSAMFGPLLNLGLLKILTGELIPAKENCSRAMAFAALYNSDVEINLCRQAYILSLWLCGDFRAVDSELIRWGKLDRLDINAWRILTVKARCHMSKLEHETANVALNEAIELYRSKALSRDVAVCLEYLGLNEYFAGNYAKAREYYDQVLAMPEPTASAVAQTLRMLTDVEIAEGNWDAAKTTAAKADAAINKISERIELGALWRAYGHIYTHDNDHAKAREYFEKSIDLLRQLGARYELALSHFDAGRSKAYSPGQQIEHLNQAKALFIDMEVPKRVAQVDTAIGKLAAVNVEANGSGERKLTLKAKAVQVPVIIAESAAMKKIVALADRIKDNDMTVLITGETGTGKDLLAEYIHKSSLRAGKPFVAVNCAAIPEAMLESELFGYKKGSYTGAVSDKPGLIETADGGTFFLNEIGEASITIQTKLLQVIEERAVRRLGDNASIKVDVRFIAATNQNLREQIAKGEFRSDLYYRLNVMPICLPPLRERAEDAVALLQMLFANRGIELNGDLGRVEDSLRSYSWPGNVRELIAIVNRVVSNHEADGADNLLDLFNSELDMESPESEERHHLLQIVAKHAGNKTRAAQELGVPVTTLKSRLKKFDF